MARADVNRRQFLLRSSLIALAPIIPAFLHRTVRAAEHKRDGHILVVIQLNGGNDGINTVVPFADEGYARHRDKLRLNTKDLIQVNDLIGLHPALRPAADLLDDGQLAIVQGVGYPNPNRSHDVSMAIWQTARFDPADHKTFGWLGRATDSVEPRSDGSPHSILLGDDSPPVALRGRQSTSVSLAHLNDLRLQTSASIPANPDQPSGEDLLAFTRRVAVDARSAAELIDQVVKNSGPAAVSYPESEFASRLKSIAQLIKADFSTPVYYAIQDGYDTHAAQLPGHARLLRELAGALKAFQHDLKAAGLANRVLTLCFSEFGRRVEENASLGTDHGTAGPVFLAGPRVLPGPVGQTPSMTDLEDGDLKMQCDFRRVYATILEDWLSVSAEAVLGACFEKLPLLLAAGS